MVGSLNAGEFPLTVGNPVHAKRDSFGTPTAAKEWCAIVIPETLEPIEKKKTFSFSFDLHGSYGALTPFVL